MTKKLNILVVEDKEENILAAQHYLSAHVVTPARTFYDAVSHLRRKENSYDVLLSDMFFSYGNHCTSSSGSFSEAPLGYATALYAARVGVPLIAIVTDCNHHSNAIAASFDAFYPGSTHYEKDDHPLLSHERILMKDPTNKVRPVLRINNSLFLMFDERDLPADDDMPYCDLHMTDFTPITSERAHIIQDMAVGRSKELIKRIKPWRTALEVMLTLRQEH